MSASPTPSPTPQGAQEILKEIADLLCPAHKHKLTPPRIVISSETSHSLLIRCPRDGKIGWWVVMSADFLFKEIRRCKVLSTCNSTPGLPGVTTVVPLGAWEGAQCDDILWLLRIGHLKEGWWEDNPSHLSDQRKDYWHRIRSAESKQYGSHHYVAYQASSPELPIALPGSKVKDDLNEKQGGEGTESQDNTVPPEAGIWADNRLNPFSCR